MRSLLSLLVFTLVLLHAASAQQKFSKPDYKAIEKAGKDKKSPLYQDSLMVRFLRGDSTFSRQEKEQLYYGFQFTDGYSPYSHSDFTDSLNKLFGKEELEMADYAKAAVFCDSILREDPFDIRIMNAQTNMFKKLARVSAAERNMVKINLIIDALLGSGDGLKEKSAYYVINVSHEYALLSVLGLEFGGQQSLIGQNDYLTVEKNEEGIEGLYFDVTASFNNMEKMFKD